MWSSCWGLTATHYIALITERSNPECHSVSIIISIISVGSIEVLGFSCCHTGILCEREDRHKLNIPVLFIVAENDDYIPLEQFD